MTDTATEIVYSLPTLPPHLYQLDQASGGYFNPMGCGAFSTAMALATYDPAYGTPAAAHQLFSEMLKVPFFGGTFEHQNAALARRKGYLAQFYDRGTVAELAEAINLGAPVVLLINPGVLGIGQHDVLLVGYSVSSEGRPMNLFIDNPANGTGTQAAPPGLSYPGNETLPVGRLAGKWTGVFTPVFRDPGAQAEWLTNTHRI
jgi:hypothetical protein